MIRLLTTNRDRLRRGAGVLEHVRTQEIVRRYKEGEASVDSLLR